MGIVTRDGYGLYPDGSNTYLGDNDFIQKAMNGQAAISDLIISKVTNELVLMFAVPVKKDSNVAGVLVGRARGDNLVEMTRDMGYGEQGYTYMINSEGAVVAHPDSDMVFNRFNPLKERENDVTVEPLAVFFEKILAERTGVGQCKIQNSYLK